MSSMPPSLNTLVAFSFMPHTTTASASGSCVCFWSLLRFPHICSLCSSSTAVSLESTSPKPQPTLFFHFTVSIPLPTPLKHMFFRVRIRASLVSQLARDMGKREAHISNMFCLFKASSDQLQNKPFVLSSVASCNIALPQSLKWLKICHALKKRLLIRLKGRNR